jgi:hypothetical protein
MNNKTKTASLEDLSAKEEELRRQSDHFKHTSDKLKKSMRRKNNRLNAILCCLCVAMAD